MKKALLSVAFCLALTAMVSCNGEKKVEAASEQAQVENVEMTFADSVLSKLNEMSESVAKTSSAQELDKLQKDFEESTKEMNKKFEEANKAGKFTQEQKDTIIQTYSKLTSAIEAKYQSFQAKK